VSESLPTPPPLPIAPPQLPVEVAHAAVIDPPEAPLSAVRWPIPLLIGLVVLNLAFVYFSSLLVGRAGIMDAFTQDGAVIVLTAVIMLQYLPALIVALWWARSHGATFADTFSFRGFNVLPGIGIAVGLSLAGRGFGMWYVSATRMLGIDAPTTPDVTHLFPLTAVGIAATVLVAVIIAPIAEEALFRGVLFAGLRDRLGFVSGMIISAAIFAGVHFSLYQFAPLFMLGLMLAYLVTKTRSIWPSIVCHAMFNGVAVGLLYVLRAIGVGS